jgi:hypothetical protein
MPLSVEAFFLSDAAHDYSGRVSVLGAFVNLIHARELPAIHQLFVVARLAWPYEEIGLGHQAAIEIWDEAVEQRLVRFGGELPQHEPDAPHADLPVGVNLVAPLAVQLQHDGLYSVRLVVDGDEVVDVRRPLKVVVVGPPES